MSIEDNKRALERFDRIGALDGELTIRSEPGSGTSVTGTVPLQD
jgi:hypothetical protein